MKRCQREYRLRQRRIRQQNVETLFALSSGNCDNARLAVLVKELFNNISTRLDSYDVLRMFLARKLVSVNSTIAGQTALYQAIQHNRPACVNLLLQARAKLDLSALHIGCTVGASECVKQILERSVEMVNCGKHTCFELAIRNNHEETAKTILYVIKQKLIPLRLTPTILELLIEKQYVDVYIQLQNVPTKCSEVDINDLWKRFNVLFIKRMIQLCKDKFSEKSDVKTFKDTKRSDMLTCEDAEVLCDDTKISHVSDVCNDVELSDVKFDENAMLLIHVQVLHLARRLFPHQCEFWCIFMELACEKQFSHILPKLITAASFHGLGSSFHGFENAHPKCLEALLVAYCQPKCMHVFRLESYMLFKIPVENMEVLTRFHDQVDISDKISATSVVMQQRWSIIHTGWSINWDWDSDGVDGWDHIFSSKDFWTDLFRVRHFFQWMCATDVRSCFEIRVHRKVLDFMDQEALSSITKCVISKKVEFYFIFLTKRINNDVLMTGLAPNTMLMLLVQFSRNPDTFIGKLLDQLAFAPFDTRMEIRLKFLLRAIDQRFATNTVRIPDVHYLKFPQCPDFLNKTFLSIFLQWNPESMYLKFLISNYACQQVRWQPGRNYWWRNNCALLQMLSENRNVQLHWNAFLYEFQCDVTLRQFPSSFWSFENHDYFLEQVGWWLLWNAVYGDDIDMVQFLLGRGLLSCEFTPRLDKCSDAPIFRSRDMYYKMLSDKAMQSKSTDLYRLLLLYMIPRSLPHEPPLFKNMVLNLATELSPQWATSNKRNLLQQLLPFSLVILILEYSNSFEDEYVFLHYIESLR